MVGLKLEDLRFYLRKSALNILSVTINCSATTYVLLVFNKHENCRPAT